VGSEVLANFWSDEGTVSGTKLVVFPWRSRRISITNDSSSASMTVALGGNTFTLKPTESLSVKFLATSTTLTGSGVAYRVWAFG
jgi:hypothetical protein